jgi:hypothetical protein
MKRRKHTKRTGPMASSGTLEQRLGKYPGLKDRMEALLAIVENRDGRLEKADDAEEAVIQQVRLLGQRVLGEWAQQQAERKAQEMVQLNPSACKDKKNSALE